MTAEIFALADGRVRTFIKLDANEVLDRQNNYDFADCGGNFLTASEAPAYRVTATSLENGVFFSSGFVPSPLDGQFSCSGGFDEITAVNVYLGYGPGLDPPAPELSAEWELVATLPPSGGPANVDADCSDTTLDAFVAVGIVTAGGDPLKLGQPTRLECDPLLADPRVRIHDRPGILDRVPRSQR